MVPMQPPSTLRADDEVAVGVDRLARADHVRPPARLAGHRVAARDVLVAGQRVADEDGVGLVGVQRAVGLVGDLEVVEPVPGIEQERLVRAKARTRLAGWSAWF